VDHRCNDGKTDPRGRLIVGTMCLDEGEAGAEQGGLYSVDHNHDCRLLLSRVSIPNGIVWSRDGCTLFHIDTPTRQVRQFAYNADSGDVRDAGVDGYKQAKVAINVPEAFGHPDGAAIDENDNIWIASWSQNTRE